MDGNKELLAGLEMTKREATTVQKLAKEGVGLLRKVEKEKKVSQAEARRLVIRSQLVYQLIHVQLVLFDWESNQ